MGNSLKRDLDINITYKPGTKVKIVQNNFTAKEAELPDSVVGVGRTAEVMSSDYLAQSNPKMPKIHITVIRFMDTKATEVFLTSNLKPV